MVGLSTPDPLPRVAWVSQVLISPLIGMWGPRDRQCMNSTAAAFSFTRAVRHEKGKPQYPTHTYCRWSEVFPLDSTTVTPRGDAIRGR